MDLLTPVSARHVFLSYVVHRRVLLKKGPNPIECTTPRVNPNVKYGHWLIMVYLHSWSVVMNAPHWCGRFFFLFWLFILYWDRANYQHECCDRASISVVMFSDEQQRDSALHLHVSIFLQLPSHPGSHIYQGESLCYMVGPCRSSILNRAVCPCPSQSL